MVVLLSKFVTVTLDDVTTISMLANVPCVIPISVTLKSNNCEAVSGVELYPQIDNNVPVDWVVFLVSHLILQDLVIVVP